MSAALLLGAIPYKQTHARPVGTYMPIPYEFCSLGRVSTGSSLYAVFCSVVNAHGNLEADALQTDSHGNLRCSQLSSYHFLWGLVLAAV